MYHEMVILSIVAKKRILGIDYGRRRIGLALSSPCRTIVSPSGYIVNKGPKKNVVPFAEFIKKYDVGFVVLGLPLYADGNESEMSREVREFGTWITDNFGLEVIYHDERLTSREAEDILRNEMHIKDPKKIAEMVDSMAANMVLNSWLQKSKEEKKNDIYY